MISRSGPPRPLRDTVREEVSPVIKWLRYDAAAMLAAGGLLLVVGSGLAHSQPASPDEGLLVFKSANCMGCHKWSGSGGGGYGGAAANLRHTSLTLDQIEKTVRCGRLGSGMPHFDANAYADGSCYGLKKAQIPPGQMPPEPDHPLRQADIDAVAKYVVANIKGKGDPTLAQCQAFFGTGTRVCDVYAQSNGKPGSGGDQPTASVQHASSGPHATSPPHLSVDAAPDANAAGGK